MRTICPLEYTTFRIARCGHQHITPFLIQHDWVVMKNHHGIFSWSYTAHEIHILSGSREGKKVRGNGEEREISCKSMNRILNQFGVHAYYKACNGQGAPIFLSFPHFYNADPVYLDQFDSTPLANTSLAENRGLNPSEEKHSANMVLENTLSIPLELNFRLQLVIKVDPDPELE